MRDEALARAIAAVGSVAALASAIGVKHQAVSAWERCPAERAKDVEKATGVPRHELRPDLWEPVPDNRQQFTPTKGKHQTT